MCALDGKARSAVPASIGRNLLVGVTSPLHRHQGFNISILLPEHPSQDHRTMSPPTKQPFEDITNTVTVNSWDDWAPQDRVMKINEGSKALQTQLIAQHRVDQKVNSKSKKGARNGSDISSARGSEERYASTAHQGGRGPRRPKDYDLEHVSCTCIPFTYSTLLPNDAIHSSLAGGLYPNG